jgi:hypothetical protein
VSTADPPFEHSASASALGYIYQCRYALYGALQRLHERPDLRVFLETIDDVVFEAPGEAVEILQTKHHLNSAASLTDTSADLWKTIRIWAQALQTDRLPDNRVLYLVTTAHARDGSAAAFLRLHNRRVAEAVALLRSVAEGSRSQTNEAGYLAFKRLRPLEQEALVSSIFVVDSQLGIASLDPEINKLLGYPASRRNLDSFRERLEGWWLRRCVRHLVEGPSTPILGEEIYAQLDELREQYKEDNLPIDEDIATAVANIAEHQEHTFVRQLAVIGISSKRIQFAINDFIRAFTQRSRWLRDDLVTVGELDKYEQQLVEEWERRFEEMRESVGAEVADEVKCEAARLLYKWAEQEADFPIRPREESSRVVDRPCCMITRRPPARRQDARSSPPCRSGRRHAPARPGGGR